MKETDSSISFVSVIIRPVCLKSSLIRVQTHAMCQLVKILEHGEQSQNKPANYTTTNPQWLNIGGWNQIFTEPRWTLSTNLRTLGTIWFVSFYVIYFYVLLFSAISWCWINRRNNCMQPRSTVIRNYIEPVVLTNVSLLEDILLLPK